MHETLHRRNLEIVRFPKYLLRPGKRLLTKPGNMNEKEIEAAFKSLHCMPSSIPMIIRERPAMSLPDDNAVVDGDDRNAISSEDNEIPSSSSAPSPSPSSSSSLPLSTPPASPPLSSHFQGCVPGPTPATVQLQGDAVMLPVPASATTWSPELLATYGLPADFFDEPSSSGLIPPSTPSVDYPSMSFPPFQTLSTNSMSTSSSLPMIQSAIHTMPSTPSFFNATIAHNTSNNPPHSLTNQDLAFLDQLLLQVGDSTASPSFINPSSNEPPHKRQRFTNTHTSSSIPPPPPPSSKAVLTRPRPRPKSTATQMSFAPDPCGSNAVAQLTNSFPSSGPTRLSDFYDDNSM